MSEKRDVTGACRSGFHWSKRSAKNPMLVSSNARANVKVVGIISKSTLYCAYEVFEEYSLTLSGERGTTRQ